MFVLLATVSALFVLSACSVPTPTDIVQSSVFARPSITYHSGDNVGVDYNVGAILDATNRREAVALIEQYCKGQYRVTRYGDGHIDAVCTH
jgi:hypothetical protein